MTFDHTPESAPAPTAPSKAFTVVVPTCDHADTLWYSVASVLQQTVHDIEVFIVGDGAPERTVEIAACLAERDPRVRFFNHPKGERHGEAYRHEVLQQAAGRFIAYQADDDLWFPDHLETLAAKLADHDLAHVMQIEVAPDGALTSWMFDARLSPTETDQMRRSETGFGLASGGHTLEAYRRLPRGWHPAPQGISTDLYFWLQFLDQPWCRYASVKWPTLCHFSSVTRHDQTLAQRVTELAAWWPRVQDPLERIRMIRSALEPLHEQQYPAFRRAQTAGQYPLPLRLVRGLFSRLRRSPGPENHQ